MLFRWPGAIGFYLILINEADNWWDGLAVEAVNTFSPWPCCCGGGGESDGWWMRKPSLLPFRFCSSLNLGGCVCRRQHHWVKDRCYCRWLYILRHLFYLVPCLTPCCSEWSLLLLPALSPPFNPISCPCHLRLLTLAAEEACYVLSIESIFFPE